MSKKRSYVDALTPDDLKSIHEALNSLLKQRLELEISCREAPSGENSRAERGEPQGTLRSEGLDPRPAPRGPEGVGSAGTSLRREDTPPAGLPPELMKKEGRSALKARAKRKGLANGKDPVCMTLIIKR